MLHGGAVNPSMILGENSAGKSNLIKCLKEDLFKNSTMFLLVDFCAFGSDIDDPYNVCKDKNIKAYFDKDYLSFEYLLLVSNFINDTDLNFYLEKNRLKYLSLEVLFTDRLTVLTSGEAFKYSKSMRDFPVCYFKDCCENRGNKGTCQKRKYFLGKKKIDWMLKGTKFEDLLRLRR